MKKNKAVVWFSCGASSAVAGKLAIQKYGNDVDLVYCDTGGEHESNMVFLQDCEKWYGRDITILKNENYVDHFDVFKKTKVLQMPSGFAYCTHKLKMELRDDAGYCESINIFGYTLEEKKRSIKLEEHNIDMLCEFPLIDEQVSKADCLGILWKEGIKLPLMYELGYDHNNCIGCVKGGMGYWNKIKIDFPEHFNKMAKIERELGVTVLKFRSGKRQGERMYLDELQPNMGNFQKEPSIMCGIDCHLTIDRFKGKGN
tara:strand:+ start:74 stop:844 length:771 start_codon:yes stop_codon:yes gene_type:complete